MSTPNSIAWNELITPNPEAAAKFYCGLFGWTTEQFPVPGMNYTMWKHDGETFGGVCSAQGPGVPPHWLHYVAVTDVEAAVAKAKSLGATLCHGPVDIGEAGRIAVLKDPQGAFFGLHQQLKK